MSRSYKKTPKEKIGARSNSFMKRIWNKKYRKTHKDNLKDIDMNEDDIHAVWNRKECGDLWDNDSNKMWFGHDNIDDEFGQPRSIYITKSLYEKFLNEEIIILNHEHVYELLYNKNCIWVNGLVRTRDKEDYNKRLRK
jgi:hypothetical protein